MTDSTIVKALTSSAGPTAVDPYVPGSGNRGYSVRHYDLDIDYRVANNRFIGIATISADASERLETFTLDLVGLVAAKVSVNGQRAARFLDVSGKLTITPARPIDAGAAFTVTVRYSGSPGPRRSPWGDVGWEELSEGVLVASQPNGAPTWFPCNDRPADKATYRIAVTAETPYRVIANGKLVASRVKASRTQWVYEVAEPMAPYLATVQIGYYSAHPLTTAPLGQVPMKAWIPSDLGHEFASDFADQPAMMEAFERMFGPYPFPDYTVVVTDDDLEIPLEAHGMSIFGRNHVDGLKGEYRLVAHELAHSWFGNSLTAASWQHIWLHEGFACYAEWLWAEDSGRWSAHRLATHYWTKLSTQHQDFLIGDPGPELMFDDRVYKRGALTLHALRLTMGDDAFFAMLRAWTVRHRHGTVTTEQFMEHAAGFTARPLGRLFRAWLFDRALPRLPRGHV
ncbi:M1 family metallopeptidase [Salinibacterium sp. ZJ454]|uniref:M1 family metallopeptidase n=1 Tax=Salinibacterium sp. ZJ454 TaxID=2708339 RepID=UPI001FBBE83A|nr:M1 family metallopeptidase [Salinibacterium sp. ZJ454]